MIVDCCLVPKDIYRSELLAENIKYERKADIAIGIEPTNGPLSYRNNLTRGGVYDTPRAPLTTLGAGTEAMGSGELQAPMVTIVPATVGASTIPSDYDRMDDSVSVASNNNKISVNANLDARSIDSIENVQKSKGCFRMCLAKPKNEIHHGSEKMEGASFLSGGDLSVPRKKRASTISKRSSVSYGHTLDESQLGDSISSHSLASSRISASGGPRPQFSFSTSDVPPLQSKAMESNADLSVSAAKPKSSSDDKESVHLSIVESELPEKSKSKSDSKSKSKSDSKSEVAVVDEVVDEVAETTTHGVTLTPASARTATNAPQGLKRVAGNKNAIGSSATGLITKDPSKMVAVMAPADIKMFTNCADFIRKTLWTTPSKDTCQRDALVAVWMVLWAARMDINGENNAIGTVIAHLSSRSKGDIVTKKVKEAAPIVEFMAKRVFRSFMDEVITKNNSDGPKVQEHVISETKFAIGEKPDHLGERLEWIEPLLNGDLYPNTKGFSYTLAKELIISNSQIINDIAEYFLDNRDIPDVNSSIVKKILG